MSEEITRRDILTTAGLGLAALGLSGAAGKLAQGAEAAAPAKAKTVRDMTAANLRSAFGGESMARNRYEMWALVAEKEEFPNVARLFRAIAHAEFVHAHNHFRALRKNGGAFLVAAGAGFGIGTTADNLAGAIEGELFEVNEMYPTYLGAAKEQGEEEAALSCRYALEAEKTHAGLYAKAKKAVEGGDDLKLGPVHICGVCGYTVEGKVPATCPICQAADEQFKAFA
jgi:rubrerythrin